MTDECLASAAAADGAYACDYAVDELYKAANAGLEAKNPAAFDFLSKFQLTTEQQSEIAGYIDSDGMTADAAAKKWVDANPDIVDGLARLTATLDYVCRCERVQRGRSDKAAGVCGHLAR